MQKPVLILYATREGQTRRIAEYLLTKVKSHGVGAEAIDAAKIPAGFSLDAYSSAVLAASIHLSRHEKEIVGFVKQQRAQLERMPAAFLSVSLSEAGAEDESAAPEKRTQAAVDVQKMIDAFVAETGWHPEHVQPVAGALRYSKYNFFVRIVMKRIAKAAGADTDTSRDYEYTDWGKLDACVDQLLQAGEG